MFADHTYRNPLERAICLFFAGLIVTSSLALGFVGVQAMEQEARAAIATMRV